MVDCFAKAVPVSSVNTHGSENRKTVSAQEAEGFVCLFLRTVHAPQPVMTAKAVEAELEGRKLAVSFQHLQGAFCHQRGIGKDHADVDLMTGQSLYDLLKITSQQWLPAADVDVPDAAFRELFDDAQAVGERKLGMPGIGSQYQTVPAAEIASSGDTPQD